jgi:hypothetical protein
MVLYQLDRPGSLLGSAVVEFSNRHSLKVAFVTCIKLQAQWYWMCCYRFQTDDGTPRMTRPSSSDSLALDAASIRPAGNTPAVLRSPRRHLSSRLKTDKNASSGVARLERSGRVWNVSATEPWYAQHSSAVSASWRLRTCPLMGPTNATAPLPKLEHLHGSSAGGCRDPARRGRSGRMPALLILNQSNHFGTSTSRKGRKNWLKFNGTGWHEV